MTRGSTRSRAAGQECRYLACTPAGARLRHAVPAYPTTSEIWLRLIESLPEDLLHPGRG